ncbi:hypothetical protein NC651_009065 [Populus alba x Populus x berolinensis]|nr:hypothetical protein NC651_009065 [Populus alba x Populus x berolinensis]
MITEEEWRLKLRERRALNEEDDDAGTGGGVAVVKRAFSVVKVVGLVGVGLERKESFDLRAFLSLRHALEAIALDSEMKRTKGHKSLVGREKMLGLLA